MNFYKAAFYMITSSILCIVSDTFTKKCTLNGIFFLFIRFSIATIILIPCFLYTKNFKINSALNFKNFIRGSLFAFGMMFFLYSLNNLSLGFTILLNFMTPIFATLLSKIFLKENLKNRLLTCIFNTFAILYSIYPSITIINNTAIMTSITAAFMFATIDVYNKHNLQNKEDNIEILLGSYFFAAMISFFSLIPSNIIKTFTKNQSIIFKELPLLTIIALTAILIPYFLLKASANADLSWLQPLKYIEFPISIASGYLFLNDKYSYHVFISFAIILFGLTINYIQENSNK